MWAFYIFLAVLVLFFVWAARRTSGRSSGPEASGERHRQTGGYSPGG
jgi:hypothetical protein